MQKKRIKYKFILSGTTDSINDVVKMLGTEITHVYGGATISIGKGFWISDGNEIKTAYNGKLSIEDAIIVDLTIMPKDENDFLPTMARIFKMVKENHDTSWRNIHTERSYIEALHFDIQANFN